MNEVSILVFASVNVPFFKKKYTIKTNKKLENIIIYLYNNSNDIPRRNIK